MAAKAKMYPNVKYFGINDKKIVNTKDMKSQKTVLVAGLK